MKEQRVNSEIPFKFDLDELAQGVLDIEATLQSRLGKELPDETPLIEKATREVVEKLSDKPDFIQTNPRIIARSLARHPSMSPSAAALMVKESHNYNIFSGWGESYLRYFLDSSIDERFVQKERNKSERKRTESYGLSSEFTPVTTDMSEEHQKAFASYFAHLRSFQTKLRARLDDDS